MKRLIYKITPLAFAFLFMSCTTDVDGLNETMLDDIKKNAEKEMKQEESPEKETTKEVDANVVEENTADGIQSRYAYDKDWELIREALISQDEAKIQNWIHGDKVKAEDISYLFTDPNVIKALKATKYADLKNSEQNGEDMLMFYYEETGVNDEGHEVGMSLSLFLHQGDPSLMIGYVLAAG